MSWLFSQALVEEFSAGTSLAGEPSAQLNVMPTQHKFWRSDKTIDASSLSRFGLTCAVLTENRGTALLMSFQEAFRAKTSAQPEREQAWPASAQDSGARWLESWAKFDPDSSTWRTLQYSLLEDSASFLGTWPRWGSMQSGESYRRPTPTLRTYGSESGYSPVFPTPVSIDSGSGRINKSPSPNAKERPTLALMARRGLWPTPTTMKATGGATLCKWGGAGARKKMSTMVSHAEMNGPLNPTWVEWLMGWPTGWSDLTPLAMGKFHEWQQQHGKS